MGVGLSPSTARAVLNRLAFGADASSFARIQEIGVAKWVDQQLVAAPYGDDEAMAGKLASIRLHVKYDTTEKYKGIDEMRPLVTLGKDVGDLAHLVDGATPIAWVERQMPRIEVTAATVQRMISSQMQLCEVVAGFWHDHFSVSAYSDTRIAVALPAYDVAIRRHALGNFRQMLEAVVTNPAMLSFLNNRSSRAGSPNENFARELFELHTMGRGAYLNALYNRWRDVPGAIQGNPDGYIDQDVYEAARAFTGWSVEDGSVLGGTQKLPTTGRFAYVEGWHDNYQKRVLGVEFDPFRKPMEDGHQVLDLVAAHPATARFICGKLCRRLVADNPPATLVEGAAKVWLDNAKAPDQLRQVVAFIAKSREASDPKPSKVRRPVAMAVALIRALGIDATVTSQMLGAMENSGHRLFGWPTPDGHPDTMGYWLSTHILRRRAEFAAGVTENSWAAGAFTPSAMVTHSMTAGEATAYWHAVVTGLSPDAATVSAILSSLGLTPAFVVTESRDQDKLVRRIVALCAMTAAFNMV